MSEKMFGTRVDDVDSTIINITRDGEDFAWFLSDDIIDKQVEKVVDKLNELAEENDNCKNDYRELFSNYVALEEKNEQLRHELDSLTGCYCADNKEFKDYWRIGYDD